MRRHGLSDAQFAVLAPYLPKHGAVGHPWADHRRMVNGLFWKLRPGVPWRDIPDRYGFRQTIDDRSVFWRRNGTCERIVRAVHVELDARHGKLDWRQFTVDRTVFVGRARRRVPVAAAVAQRNRPTMRLVAHAVASAPRSTCGALATAFRSAPSACQDRRTSPHNANPSSTA